MCNMVNIKNNIGENIAVADIKADAIKNMISLASECELIDYIYLFGSTIEDRCTDKSDIDIAIVADVCDSKLVRNKEFKEFRSGIYDIAKEQSYDILQFRTVNDIKSRQESVCRDILEKGKIIYRKIKG